MSQKRISQVPSESLTGANIDIQNGFLGKVCRIDPCTLHFFDEASVIHTTGNRRYGHAYIGEPAIEFQRNASNANFTVNLLHSVMGVDHYNILDGPSNGTEMLLPRYSLTMFYHRKTQMEVLCWRGEIRWLWITVVSIMGALLKEC